MRRDRPQEDGRPATGENVRRRPRGSADEGEFADGRGRGGAVRREARCGREMCTWCTCGETSRRRIRRGGSSPGKAQGPHPAAHGPPAWETVHPRGHCGGGVPSEQGRAGEAMAPGPLRTLRLRAGSTQPVGCARHRVFRAAGPGGSRSRRGPAAGEQHP